MALNLHQHAVLEASAGTGKTHTIGELVLRLLKEEGVALEQILIVTYTEKATGELKARLRSTLEKELAASSEHRERLRLAVDRFDQAWIFTLHGFCRRILQEFPLEQGQDAGSQLVSDSELLERCLREIQRSSWRKEYPALLHEVLEISDYRGPQAEFWEAKVRELAEKMRSGGEQRLEPAAIADWPGRLASLRAALLQTIPQLDTLWQQFEQNPGCEFLREKKQIKNWLQDPVTRSLPLKTFHGLVRFLDDKHEFRQNGFRGLLGRRNGQSLPEQPGPASQIVALLDSIHRDRQWHTFGQQLAVRTVPVLQEALDEYKKQHGLWSFHDMIVRVDEALDPAQNPRAGQLAAALQRRFRFGIVDEFQDTDPLQWRILQRIFLAGSASTQREQVEDSGGEEKRTRNEERGIRNEEFSAPRLFLVGDPKQAIFGFRGADLPTYQSATRELLERHRAQDQPLRVNWRSSPELIAGLNRLFHQGEWFPPESGIRYLDVEPAPEEDRPSKLLVDRTARPAVNLVDWRQDQFLARLRRRHADFIVREIARLLEVSEDGPTMVSIKRGEPRPLHAGDICVLVLRRAEARPLLAGLRQAGIPYSFYKQADLWKSQEAVHLRLVLEALSQPEHRGAFRKALLTGFFRVQPQDLAQCDAIDDGHPARTLFEDWQDLAARRQWASLFQSMLEDTGLFFADQGDTDVDRRRANYRHLTSQLMQQAYQQNLDLISLTEWFRRQEKLGIVDEDVQPKETERPRVQIMTIHASKGLEFPIVFLAGGWTQRQGDSVLVYREDVRLRPGAESSGTCQVFDITNPPLGSPARLAAERDRQGEHRRLLYVALTRAMFKLYVPFTLTEGTYWKLKGPVVQLLAPALERVLGQDSADQTGPACMGVVDPWDRIPILSMKKRFPAADDSAAGSSRTGSESHPAAWHIDGPLLPRLDPDLSRRGMVIRSFTSLHRASRASEQATFVLEPPRAEDEDGPVRSPENESEAADPLRGTVFGEIVHGVLEKIDFEAVGQAAAPKLLLADRSATEKVLSGEIEQHLPQLPSKLPLEELRLLCRERVAQLVWHALHTPLPELGCPLWQIPRRDRLVELAFHFPEHEMATTERREESFLTGFIDLVVRRAGRFFIIDWKTNDLAGYGTEELAREMKERDYHLQYRLYLQALVRWLRRSLGPTFDWSRDLGGVYYLFLRGLGSAAGQGVFYHRPTAADLRLDLVLAR